MFKVAPGYIWFTYNKYMETKDDKSYNTNNSWVDKQLFKYTKFANNLERIAIQ